MLRASSRATQRRHGRSGVTAIAVAMLTAALFTPFEAANAAAATATGLSLQIVGDDTAALVGDNSTSNGIVPVTGGEITYRWNWSGVPGGGDAVFSQTLPVGVTWKAASIASGCSVTGSYLTTGETLTCTIPNLTDIPGATNKIAVVKNLPTGTVIYSSLVSGSNTSSPVTVTTAAASTANVLIAAGLSSNYKDANDPETGLVPGFQIPFSFGAYVVGTSSENIKGQESFGSNATVTFTLQIPEGAVVSTCGTSDSFRAGNGSTRGISTSGTLSCSQSGRTVTVTFSGVDGRLNSVATNFGWPTRGFFATGGMNLWMPTSMFSSTATPVTVSLLTEPSNLQSVSGVVSTPTAANASYTVGLTTFTVTSSESISAHPYPAQRYFQRQTLAVPTGAGQSAQSVTACQVWDPALQRIDAASPLGVSATNTTINSSNYIVEYGTAVYNSDEERRTADCGVAGDGALGWYSSVTEAGGAAEVSAVRIKFTKALGPSQTFYFDVYVTAPTSPTLNPTTAARTTETWLPFIANYSFNSGSPVREGAGVTYSSRARLSTADVASSIFFGASGPGGAKDEAKPGGTISVTVQPSVAVSAGVPARLAVGVRQTVTLPNACFSYVPGTPAPITVSAAGTPTGLQTCRDVAGQTITWDLGDVMTGTALSPITFAVNLDPATPRPVDYVISTYTSSTSDYYGGSGSDDLLVQTVDQFQISLTASATSVSDGLPFSYRAGWNNASSSEIEGTAWVWDVLPRVGDSRNADDTSKTTGLTSLTVQQVTTVPAGRPVQYTTAPLCAVESALQAAEPGGLTETPAAGCEPELVVWEAWSNASPPADTTTITALRVETQHLDAGVTGYMEVTVTPQGLASDGVLVNDLSTTSDAIASGYRGYEDLTLRSSSSTITGTAFLDTNYSYSLTGGEQTVAGATVTLKGFNYGADGINNTGRVAVNGAGDVASGDTYVEQSVTVAGDGTYSFGVSPGLYSVSISDSSVAPGDGNTYDLAVTPASPFDVGSAVTVTAKDFGYQVPMVDPVAADDSTVGGDSIVIYQGESVAIPVLDNDTFDDAQPGFGYSITSAPARGTATIGGDRSITYTANAVWPGSVTGLSYTSTFQYTLSNAQSSDAATVTVTVLRKPFATTDKAQLQEGQGATIDVLWNDQGDRIELDSAVTPTSDGSGSVSVNGDFDLVYTQGAYAWSEGETSYLETITYGIKDHAGYTATGSVQITVYRAPVAANDTKVTAFDTRAIIAALSNDFIGASPYVLSIETAPSQGTAEVVGEAALQFTPAAGSSGVFTFEYRVTDNFGQYDIATVTVTVAANFTVVNDGSVASPVLLEEDGGTIEPLTNDTGTDLTISALGEPEHGAVTRVGGVVTYVPDAGYSGPDSFTYTARDVIGDTRIGTVYVETYPVPVTVNDATWTDLDTVKTVDVLGNDAFSGTPTLTIETGPTYGDAAVVSGQIEYTPDRVGTYTITYRVTDAVGQSSTGELTVTVVRVFTAINDGSAPAPVMLPVGGGDIDALANDAGSDLVLTEVTQGSHGAVSIVAGKARYVPDAGYTGTDTFTYTVEDQVGESRGATVTVRVLAQPIAVDDALIAALNETDNLAVEYNDTLDGDVEVSIESTPDALNFEIVGGVLSVTASEDGVHQFVYRITDEAGQSSLATVTLYVFAPFHAHDDGSVSEPIILPITGGAIDVLANDTGTDLSISVDQYLPKGEASVEGDHIVYTPYPGQSGLDTFMYQAEDIIGQERLADVTVNVLEVPVTGDDTATVVSSGPGGIDVLANDTFAPGSVATIATPPSVGTAVVEGGRLRYTAPAGYDGTVTLSYKVTDPAGQESVATVTVDVWAPAVARDDASRTNPYRVTAGRSLTLAVLVNDSGTGLRVESAVQPSSGTVRLVDGSLVFTPRLGFSGTTTVAYTVVDSHGQRSTATVFITVAPAPVAPVEPVVTPEPSAEPTASATPGDGGGTAGGEGDGSGGGDILLLNVFEEYFGEGKQIVGGEGQVVYFDIEKPEIEPERHSVTVLGLTETSVDVVLRSEPIYDTLHIGDKKLYDVDFDGFNDIQVELNAIVDGVADITFTQFEQPSAEAVERSAWQWWWWLLLLLPPLFYVLWRRSQSQSAKHAVK